MAQRGKQLVAQMRGSAAAIGRSVNRRHNQIPHFATPTFCTSWLRGDDSAPNWGSCGKPPSSLYVRNGGAVSNALWRYSDRVTLIGVR